MNPPTITSPDPPHSRSVRASGTRALVKVGQASGKQGRGLQTEVVFPDASAAGRLGAHVLGPHLDELCAPNGGAWWFTRDEAAWHLHMDGVEGTPAGVVLDRLTDRGILSHWAFTDACPPQTLCFTVGASDAGRMGLDEGLADLYRVDSRWVLAYLRQEHPLLGERHVAGILASVMCRSAGLDQAAAADVLDILARHRVGLDEGARTRAQGLTGILGTLLRTSPGALLGAEDDVAGWVSDLAMAARRLSARTNAHPGLTGREQREAHLHDQLVRALAAQWGRLGLSATEQTILAVATRDVLRSKGQTS